MVVDESALIDQSLGDPETTKAQNSSMSELDTADFGLKKAKIGGVLSTPAVRNFAKQLGVSIEDVHGTGNEGRIIKEDVLNYVAQKGILKEVPTFLNDSSAEQFLGGDQKIPDVPSAYGWKYEDRTLPLRYILLSRRYLIYLRGSANLIFSNMRRKTKKDK